MSCYDYWFMSKSWGNWADIIPYGWRVAFGDEMVEELAEILNKYNVANYEIVQIKEKYGRLCWYDNGVPEEAYGEYSAWLNKYEELSEHTCINCGQSATHLTKGWIIPLCDDCDRVHY